MSREEAIRAANKRGIPLGKSATKKQALAALASGKMPKGAPKARGAAGKSKPKSKARKKPATSRVSAADLSKLKRDFDTWRSGDDAWRIYEAAKVLSVADIASMLTKYGIPASPKAPKKHLIRALFMLKGSWYGEGKIYVLPYRKTASTKAKIQRNFDKKHATDAKNKAVADRAIKTEKSMHTRDRRRGRIGARSRR